MTNLIEHYQILIIVFYVISILLFITCLIVEKKITVLELLVAIIVLLIPILNVIILGYTILEILNRYGIINLKDWKNKIFNFLNYRIK